MSDVIKTNCAYRIMADINNKIWHKISMYKKAQDIEFDSGKNAQTTIGAITGITSSLTSTSTTTVASASSIKQLNDKIIELQQS